MNFHVGQKVVCISRTWSAQHGEAVPSYGTVYTVRELTYIAGVHGIRLNEVHNAPRQYIEALAECTFNEVNFKPLEYKAMSIFRAIAANPKLPIKETQDA